jgi:polyisoprenoid-binding protein YceI
MRSYSPLRLYVPAQGTTYERKRMKTLYISSVAPVLVASAFFAFGCDNEPAAGKTKVEAQQAVEVKPQAPSPAATVVLPLNPSVGSVEFIGAKVTDKHEGKFKDFSGTVSLVPGAVEKSQVEVTIDIGSMEIEPVKLRGHLMSPDFFDQAKFPKATFTSTSITADPKAGTTHQITGNLELHGVKKSITFPATISATNDSVSVAAEFAINRKDFDLVYPGMPDDLIKDDVLIKIKLSPHKS